MNGVNKGFWLVAMTALVSGVSIFLNSFAVKGFDSSVFTFSKNILVAILLFTVIVAFREFDSLKKLSGKSWMMLVTIGFVGGSIPFLLFFKGLQLTTGTLSSFIHKTMFIFAGVLALLFLKERLDRKAIIAGGAVLIGTFLMIRPSFVFSMAHLMILGAVLLWSLENVLAKKALSGDHGLSGNIVAWGRMFFGSIFIFAYLAAVGKAGMAFTMSGAQYLWILATGALLFMYVITYYNGLKYMSVLSATAVLSLGAPITALLSFAFNNGAISLVESAGMLAIAIGVILFAWKSEDTVHAKTTSLSHE